MAQLHTVACLAIDAPPRTVEQSVFYTAGVNGGIEQLGAAPPSYRRQFSAFILDADFVTKWNELLAAKSAATVVDVQGKGVATKAVILDFDWQVGPHTTLDNGATWGTVVYISALLAYAVP